MIDVEGKILEFNLFFSEQIKFQEESFHIDRLKEITIQK